MAWLTAVLVVAGPAACDRAPQGSTRLFAHYYLWWTDLHWHDKLGADYPYAAEPLPLPASLGQGGCGARSLFADNELTDVPAALWTQDDPRVIERDVRLAAEAGIDGFIPSWIGSGEPGQGVSSTGFSRRLDYLVRAVEQLNEEGTDFSLWLGLTTSAQEYTARYLDNDLEYLWRTYGDSPALDRSYGKPIVVWTGSREYTDDTLEAVTEEWEDRFLFIGDATETTWPDHEIYLDGNQYYWSSQDPYENPASFAQLRALAAQVRPKLWFAPFTPGFQAELLEGGTCVPRNGLETMRRLWEGNRDTEPDAMVLISWNEITEGTYVVPLQRYGTTYLDALQQVE
jgi:hypothetical protein